MKHNEVIFQIGTKVVVKSDYCQHTSMHRHGIATVERHEINSSLDSDFVDNYVRFETGEIEQFANWEVTELIKK